MPNTFVSMFRTEDLIECSPMDHYLKFIIIIILIIIILFEYHHKKVQSSTKCTGIQYTPAMVNNDIKARK